MPTQTPSIPLLAIAAPVEWHAIAKTFPNTPNNPSNASSPQHFIWAAHTLGPCDAVLTGVSKANAAAAIATAFNPNRHTHIISIGIAGSLPRPHTSPAHLPIGSIVIATDSLFADEGIATPTGFETLAQMGFPIDIPQLPTPAPDAFTSIDNRHADACTNLANTIEAALTNHLSADHLIHRGPIATVSTCSGTDALAHAIATRTNAIAETMEGAAARATTLTLSRKLGRPIPFAEIRSISNNTGDRHNQVWKIKDACEALTRIAPTVVTAKQP